MKLNLRQKIILISGVILLLGIGANTVTVSFIFSKEYARALESKITTLADSLKLQLNRVLSLGIPLEQLVGFEQQARDVVEKKEVEKAKEKVEIINQELSKKLEELERMNKLMVGRELKMTEMKKEIEELKNKSGQT